MPTADKQKDRVYAWEDAWWGFNKSLITLARAKKLITKSCRKYKTKVPKIKTHRSGLSEYDPNTHVISLNRTRGINVPTALHEAAHAIIWHRYGPLREDHGEEFVKVYLALLVDNAFAPRVALVASLKSYGVKW